jgi:hypothetical protein
MGRPPLTEEEVQARIDAYCARYKVSAGPGGLPPFPSGKRETPQHRAWLTVYRAHLRLTRRSADARTTASRCPVCDLALEPDEAVRYVPSGKRSGELLLHRRCLELVQLAEKVGPRGVARLSALLWS